MMETRIITFDPVEHKYKDEYNSPYISVTQKIQTVIKPFNRIYWAKYKAREEGVSYKVILDRWDRITDTSIVKGNTIHGTAEDSFNESITEKDRISLCLDSYNRINGNRSSVPYNPVWGYEVDLDVFADSLIVRLYPKLYDIISKYINAGFKLYSEKRIYSAAHLIAGTIDLLLVKGDSFVILDWKTNKDKIKFKSGYYKKFNGIKTNTWVDTDDRFLKPLQHLQQCKGMIYTMQLSTYALLCELWGYKCLGLVLCHLQAEMSPVGDILPKGMEVFNIEYKKNDALTLINYKTSKAKQTRIFQRDNSPYLDNNLNLVIT